MGDGRSLIDGFPSPKADVMMWGVLIVVQESIAVESGGCRCVNVEASEEKQDIPLGSESAAEHVTATATCLSQTSDGKRNVNLLVRRPMQRRPI